MQSANRTGYWVAGVGLSLLSGVAWAQRQFDMTPGVTEVSQQVFDMHRLMLWICTVIGVVVFGLMFYSIYAHRKSKGAKAAHFHESTTVEIIWTVIPFIILIAMAIPATKVLISQYDTSASALTVKVTGSRWKWHYEYLEYEGKSNLGVDYLSVLSTPREQFENPVFKGGLFPYFSGGFQESYPEKGPHYKAEVDKPLVIPTGKKVRLLLTSDDVIHAWWMPDFAVKRDAIPGFINEIWVNVPEGKEGIYRGQCAELCGKDHAYMPIVVIAKNQQEFDAWLADSSAAQRKREEEEAAGVNKTFTLAEQMATGEKVYLAKCAMCHQATGTGLPPTFPKLAGADITTNKARIEEQIGVLLNGRNAMPAFGNVLSPVDLSAVITYTRNAWGNDTGDIIQPADVVKQ
jgi:cytochrome c oxidase subunit 2